MRSQHKTSQHKKESRITANAIKGRGGNIKIKATGLFVSPDSSITATSESGIDGTVNIDTPNPNLSGAIKPVLEKEKFSKGRILCGVENEIATRAAQGEFYIFGANIGPSPFDVLDTDLGWHDPIYVEKESSQEEIITVVPESEDEAIEEYVEAQGAAWNPDGTIRLTAEPNLSVLPYGSLSTPACTQQ